MNTLTAFPERLQRAFQSTRRGVIGLVDDLLSLCREQELQFDWQNNRCLVRNLNDGPQELIEMPLPKSVFRAILARMAALCNEQIPNSVSPYEGEGQFEVATNPQTVFRVVFANTPGKLRLEVRRVVTDNRVAKGDNNYDRVAADRPTRRHELSKSELAILGSLMESMIRGGQGVLLTEDLADMDERDIDPDKYLNALEMTIGVRPRNLDTVVMRKFMGSVISHWIRLKVSLGLIAADDEGLAIHHAAAQFANAYPLATDRDSEREGSKPT